MEYIAKDRSANNQRRGIASNVYNHSDSETVYIALVKFTNYSLYCVCVYCVVSCLCGWFMKIRINRLTILLCQYEPMYQ